MTDNVTNLLLGQALMARLHPPGTGGLSTEDLRRIEEQRREEEAERRLRERLRRRGEELLQQQMGMSPNERVEQAFSALPGPPQWFRDIQKNGWQVHPPQPFPDHWVVPRVPNWDLSPENYGPLNQPVTPPIPSPTYPGETPRPSQWPPSR